MARYAWILAVTSLVFACKGKDENGDDGTTGEDSGDSSSDGCDVDVDGTYPLDGASDMYYRGAVEFQLSDPDDSATLSVADSGGTNVSGTVTWNEDGDVMYFTPDSPFSPSTSYTATASICDGEKNPAISFTTSALGTPLDCDLTDRTYTIDLTNARFVEPEGVADLLLGQLEQDIFAGVVAYDDSSLQMIGAISGDDGGQDFCNPSIDFPEADFSGSPYFSVGPQDTDLSVAGYSITISELVISGTFASDCSLFGGGVLAGELDARVLATLLVELVGTDDPDEICTLLQGFGVSCGTCSSDGANYCINVLADQIIATEETSLTLECVAEEDCHANCADSAANADCDTSDYPTCE